MSNPLFPKELTRLITEIIETPRMEMQYAMLLPTADTPKGAEFNENYTTLSIAGGYGEPRVVTGRSDDFPIIDFNFDKKTNSAVMAGFAIDYSYDDLKQGKYNGWDTIQLKTQAGLISADNMLNNLIFSGAISGLDVGFTGLGNNPNATIMVAAPSSATGATAWGIGALANKTGEEMVNDLLNLANRSRMVTFGAIASTHILLPSECYELAARTFVANSFGRTVLQTFNDVIGRDVKVLPMINLKTAGVGGVGRAIAYTNNKSMVRSRIPVPPTFLLDYGIEDLQKGPMHWQRCGITRVGGVEVIRNDSVTYMDGVY
jgi:hypothetical protein